MVTNIHIKLKVTVNILGIKSIQAVALKRVTHQFNFQNPRGGVVQVNELVESLHNETLFKSYILHTTTQNIQPHHMLQSNEIELHAYALFYQFSFNLVCNKGDLSVMTLKLQSKQIQVRRVRPTLGSDQG